MKYTLSRVPLKKMHNLNFIMVEWRPQNLLRNFRIHFIPQNYSQHRNLDRCTQSWAVFHFELPGDELTARS